MKKGTFRYTFRLLSLVIFSMGMADLIAEDYMPNYISWPLFIIGIALIIASNFVQNKSQTSNLGPAFTIKDRNVSI